MSKIKVMLLVVTTAALFLETFAAPYGLLLQPQRMSTGWATNSIPALLALNRDNILTLLPPTNERMYSVLYTDERPDLTSNGKNIYYILNSESLGGEHKFDLPPSDDGLKSSITVPTTDTSSLRLPTVGDVINLIPFLPIEINVPGVISSMTNFFNWITNRPAQEQSTPRIYFLVKSHQGYTIYPLSMKSTKSLFPYDTHPSYGVLRGKLMLPA